MPEWLWYPIAGLVAGFSWGMLVHAAKRLMRLLDDPVEW